MIERLADVPAPAALGGKAARLAWLIGRGEQVPPTWVVRPGTSTVGLVDALRPADGAVRYAVRSSAAVEDGAVDSYAGQFVTELDVEVMDVEAAIARVRASGTSERVVAYRRHLGRDAGVEVSVLIQPMVRPVASGVAFSRNPLTGLNEVVVEAVAGRGDRLVDDGVTPDRWIHRWGRWVERPVAGALTDAVVLSIVEETRRIAGDFGAPVDLEWVWDGDTVWWLQLRPITGIDDVSVYSNRISREVMPGIIKPLVWSVNVPMVNRAWVDLFTEAIGPNSLAPESLAKAFAYRSYFNMGAIGDIFEVLGMPRDSLEVLLGLPDGSEKPSFKPTARTMRLLPRMLRMAVNKARYAGTVPRQVRTLMAAYRPFDRHDLDTRSDSALLSDVRALTDIGVGAAYANIVTPLLANLHNALLRRRLARAGLDPEVIDIGATAKLADLDPNAHLDALAERFAELDDERIDVVRSGGYATLPDELRAEVDAFLGRFGHLSASGNDFSVAPWSETPDEVVALVLDHSSTHGTISPIEWADARLRFNPVVRPLLDGMRRRTRELIEHRESVSFTYTYGYGLFRRYFLEIGRRLADRGLLDQPDDVMYLYLGEVGDGLLGNTPQQPLRALVAARREEIESLRDVHMPEIIYGDDFVPAPPGSLASALAGIPTSRGHHRGVLRVVRDTSEFAKVKPGDVIAIPYSDVGWTPLFARAGAVVAEAGGILSHSSIVAREYRIPCVVSVAGAMRLPDGAIVTVDGYAGTIAVEDAHHEAGRSPKAGAHHEEGEAS